MRAFKQVGRLRQIFLAALLCTGIVSNRLLADDKQTSDSLAKSAPARSDSPVPELPERERIILDHVEQSGAAPEEPQSQATSMQAQPKWQYGGFIDVGYSLDFNHPSNHLFRNRSTAFRVDEVDLNMAGAYLKKQGSQDSRWGMELAVHGGKDSEGFGYSPTAPNVSGSNVLRHFGLADVSYLAPVGNGITVQAGLFNSFIGYDSLYAKDNFEYTRPWGADYTPYLMFGLNASYPFSKKITATGFVINDYFHLAHPNNVPSFGGQLACSATEHLTFKETILYGSHQPNTAFEFWRFFSDSISEWKTDHLTTAFEYQIGTERVDVSGGPRALWMSAQLPLHRSLGGPWSVTLRPEVAWDRDTRWTGFQQTVKAFTATLEYRKSYRKTNTIARLEYRFDDSRGKGGGFFRGTETSPGIDSLTPSQHLLIFGLIFALDSH